MHALELDKPCRIESGVNWSSYPTLRHELYFFAAAVSGSWRQFTQAKHEQISCSGSLLRQNGTLQRQSCCLLRQLSFCLRQSNACLRHFRTMKQRQCDVSAAVFNPTAAVIWQSCSLS